jgi:hypothetical protein
LRAVARSEEFGHPRHRPAARTDGDRCTDDVADHVVEERVGGEVEAQSVAVAPQRRNRQRPDGGTCLALGGAERREVVRADEARKGSRHRVGIQRPVVPADLAGEDRRTHRRVHQHVGVVPRGGGEAGVKVGGDRCRPLHGHRRRQVRVDAAHPRRQRARRRGVEVDDLRGRVDAGVGAPGRDAADALGGDLRQRRFEHVLRAAAAGLRLPAPERLARVLETQRNSHRGGGHCKRNP